MKNYFKDVCMAQDYFEFKYSEMKHFEHNVYVPDYVITPLEDTMGFKGVFEEPYDPLKEYQFANTDIKNYVVPSDVTCIPHRCFSNCKQLTSVTLNNGLKKIQLYAFEFSAITSIIIPEGVSSIMTCAFYSCKQLTNVILPSSLKEIGVNAFFGCDSLKSIVIPEGITKIRSSCFSCCSQLTNIELPKTLIGIMDNAFYKTGLIDITLKENCQYVGHESFGSCKFLKKIYFYKRNLFVCNDSLKGSKKCQYAFLPNDNATFDVVNLLVSKEQVKRTKKDYCDCYGKMKLLFDNGGLSDPDNRKPESCEHLCILTKRDTDYDRLIKINPDFEFDITNQNQFGYFPYFGNKK